MKSKTENPGSKWSEMFAEIVVALLIAISAHYSDGKKEANMTTVRGISEIIANVGKIDTSHSRIKINDVSHVTPIGYRSISEDNEDYYTLYVIEDQFGEHMLAEGEDPSYKERNKYATAMNQGPVNLVCDMKIFSTGKIKYDSSPRGRSNGSKIDLSDYVIDSYGTTPRCDIVRIEEPQ